MARSYSFLAGEKNIDPDYYATGSDWGDDDLWDLGDDWDIGRAVWFLGQLPTFAGYPRHDDSGELGQARPCRLQYGHVRRVGSHVQLLD